MLNQCKAHVALYIHVYSNFTSDRIITLYFIIIKPLACRLASLINKDWYLLKLFAEYFFLKKDAHFHVSPDAPTVIKQQHSSGLHYLFIGKKYLDIMALWNFFGSLSCSSHFLFHKPFLGDNDHIWRCRNCYKNRLYTLKQYKSLYICMEREVVRIWFYDWITR